MDPERVREFVRHFPENGMKLLLQTPANVRDLLALGGVGVLGQLDLERMTIDPTSYVAADYRHAASDVVLSVPRRSARSRKRRALWVTILIEHQSEPDRLMTLRLLEYMVQIWKKQVRDHVQQHGSAASVRLQPILPVVVYTGSYAWEQLGQLIDLMVDASDLRRHLPEFEPVFVNLPELPEGRLSAAGPFGEVLRVVRRRKAARHPFEQVLSEVVGRLDAVAKGQRPRWRDLLAYLTQLVYHERAKGEREELAELIESTVGVEDDRLEVNMARQTIAEAIREEGAIEGRREQAVDMLLKQLRLRFETVPAQIEQTIQATRDLRQLNQWLERFATAKTLKDVGVGAP
jgi:hypothetical protein